jgi:heat shock protein HslJ
MKVFFLIACIALSIWSCSEKPKEDNGKSTEETAMPSDTNKTSPSATVNLTDIRWKLKELAGRPVSDYPAQNKEPYLIFKTDGTVEGTGGCNGMSGGYSLMDGGKIKFSQLVSTKMACPDMTVETAFHAALEKADMYTADGKILTLGNTDMPAWAIFEAAAQ